MKGWGVRPADWQIGVTVQHEILPRVSLEVGYSRRWLQNFTVTDNLARAVPITRSSASPRRSIPVCPAAAAMWSPASSTPIQNVAALTNNYRTYAPNYGKQYSIYNGLELSVSARLRSGVQFQAGSSTGETVTDNCEIRAKLPEISFVESVLPQRPGHHDAERRAPRSYTIPKIDVLLSGTFQSSPGGVLAANWIIPNADGGDSALGRRSLQSGAEHHRESARSPGRCAASGSIRSTSASASSCASAGSEPRCRSTCSTC